MGFGLGCGLGLDAGRGCGFGLGCGLDCGLCSGLDSGFAAGFSLAVACSVLSGFAFFGVVVVLLVFVFVACFDGADFVWCLGVVEVAFPEDAPEHPESARTRTIINAAARTERGAGRSRPLPVAWAVVRAAHTDSEFLVAAPQSHHQETGAYQ